MSRVRRVISQTVPQVRGRIFRRWKTRRCMILMASWYGSFGLLVTPKWLSRKLPTYNWPFEVVVISVRTCGREKMDGKRSRVCPLIQTFAWYYCTLSIHSFGGFFFRFCVCPSSEVACIFFYGNSDIAYQTGSKEIPAPPLPYFMKASKLNPSSVKLG